MKEINPQEAKPLEYKIGKLEMNPEKIGFRRWEVMLDLGDRKKYGLLHAPDDSHLFVVEALENLASIYVASKRYHERVVEQFGLNEKHIVGGGGCYINPQRELVLDEYSGDYGAIPKEAAQRFAELILPELQKLGVEISGIAVNPNEFDLRSFWREKGFDFNKF